MPVDLVQVERACGREDEHRATRLDGVERSRRRTDHGRADGSVRLASGACGIRVDCEDVVAPMLERRAEEAPDEALADHEHAPARKALGSAQHASKRLRVRADGVVHGVGKLDPAACRVHALREASRCDRRRSKGRARRLVACEAARALAARKVMHERDPAAVLDLADDLVTEDRAGRRDAELLHVGAAEPAGEDADDLRAARLRDVRDLGLPGGP